MKFTYLSLTLFILGAVVSLVGITTQASAAKPTKPSGNPTTVGYDVSYPQCGTTLPKDFAFAIVGVNGGLATTANDCLASQLKWAQAANGSVASQPPVQLYVNTGNPGEVIDQYETAWPSGGTAPNGEVCDGTNSWACSWVYGYERAKNTVENIFKPAALTVNDFNSEPSSYMWWLDVETTNSWQEAGTPEAYANNRATLEGMVAYFKEVQITKIGIYSTNYQWNTIAGAVPAESSLYTLPSWMAGARTLRGAQENCKNSPLVPGNSIVLSQYVSKGLDHNYACQ